MKQIIRQIGLLIAALLAVLPASAYDFEVNGIYYNITSMSNLEVEVTYSEFDDYGHNITPYSGNMIIPSTVNYSNRTYTVTGIGARAFGSSATFEEYELSAKNNSTAITQITLPENIKYIDRGAFQGCNISTIKLPAHLEEIRPAAFAWTSINNIVIPNSVTSIGEEAFYSSELESIVLGKSITNIEDRAFVLCKKLKEVFYTSPNKPKLGNYCFALISSFIEYYVPSVDTYGFGTEYISFPRYDYNYTGQKQYIEWNNNLKAYKCDIAENDCFTSINAGQYSKTLTATYSNGVDFSIDIPYNYTINKAPMSLIVDSKEREYGELNPTFTCNIYGFIKGESLESLGITPKFYCDANKYSNTGTYRIEASLNAPNYDIIYDYGELRITQAPITVRVEDANKVFGSINPDILLSYSGLKNGETTVNWVEQPRIETSASQYSNVGSYTVSAFDGIATNYKVVNYMPGTLTISKKDLTAAADNLERLYHEENPKFIISYSGFVGSDTRSVLDQKPVIECSANINSNAGKYPITVSGGQDNNYNIICKDGTLTINPLKVGFKNEFNSVTYNDMSISSSKEHFNYMPEITGPYNPEDFWVELWFLDKDNKYPNQHIETIYDGDYAGNYVNTNVDRTMWAGKYIYNLTSKGTNPNVTADPARCYVTVNRTNTNLHLIDDSPIEIGIGEKAELGIVYDADMWCTFNTEYDNEVVSLTSTNSNSSEPHWYVTGLTEGSTILYFSITCNENEFGFYDFADSNTIYKTIRVTGNGGIDGVTDDYDSIAAKAAGGKIIILNKPYDLNVKVFTTQGLLVADTYESEISNLAKGFYIVTVGSKSFKISI